MLLDEQVDPFVSVVEAAASPYGPSEGRDLLEAIAVDECRSTLRQFVAQVQTRIDVASHLLSAIDRFAQKISCFEDVWRPALGAPYHAHFNPDNADFLHRVTTELAAHAAEAESVAGRDHWPELSPCEYRTDEDRYIPPVAIQPEMTEALANALSLLDTCSPLYAAWVRGSVCRVTALERDGTKVMSWSSLHYPGLVSMTLFDSPIDMAETLVHEASHQWFHMLNRSFRLVQPTDRERLVWSPVKQCDRPLPRILLSFHAFGNIAIFFTDLWRAGFLEQAEYDFHMSDLREWLPAMVQTLESAALTSDGERLWRALNTHVEPVLCKREAMTA